MKTRQRFLLAVAAVLAAAATGALCRVDPLHLDDECPAAKWWDHSTGSEAGISPVVGQPVLQLMRSYGAQTLRAVTLKL